VRPTLGSRALAELVGTALLVGIGTGSLVATDGRAPLLVYVLAWFLAVAIPIALFAGRSGAHLNPALSVFLVLRRHFPATELPAYLAAQVAGAFLGSAAVWAIWGPAAHLGATLPRTGLVTVFVAELLFTTFLALSVLVLAEVGAGPHRWRLLLPPLVVAASTYCIGPLTGSGLNPARSLAPAVLSGTVAALPVYLAAAAAAVGLAWALAFLLSPVLTRSATRDRDAPIDPRARR
jgi:glycerol uptake facilitator-like aquaporin